MSLMGVRVCLGSVRVCSGSGSGRRSRVKMVLSFEEAEKLLPRGESVHTYRQAGYVLLGADWGREDLLALMRGHEIRVAGPHAQALGHGLVVHDEAGSLFIETADRTDGETP